VERCIPKLEQETLLRIHRTGLGGRDAECAIIESLRAQNEPTVGRTL
jgi:hypothetical protein